MRDAFGRVQSVAVVGGTSEIGLACARRLLGPPAADRRLILAGRHPAALAAALEASGFRGDTVVLDVADPTGHRDAVEGIFAGGDVDVVILAAGVLEGQERALADIEPAVRMGAVNGLGSLSVLLAAANRLRAQGHGHLIVLSSVAVARPRPDNYLYGASKVMVDFAARGLAGDLAGSGVGVTVARPGFVRTKMTAGMKPAPFSATAEDVAEAVAGAVASGRTGVLWVPRQVAAVALALKLLPRSLLGRMRS